MVLCSGMPCQQLHLAALGSTAGLNVYSEVRDVHELHEPPKRKIRRVVSLLCGFLCYFGSLRETSQWTLQIAQAIIALLPSTLSAQEAALTCQQLPPFHFASPSAWTKLAFPILSRFAIA